MLLEHTKFKRTILLQYSSFMQHYCCKLFLGSNWSDIYLLNVNTRTDKFSFVTVVRRICQHAVHGQLHLLVESALHQCLMVAHV